MKLPLVQLRAFIEALPSSKYYADLDTALEAHKRQSLFNVIDLATGWKIDLIIRKSRAFSQEEFRRRQPVTLHGAALFVATAEDVVIAKLEWAKLVQSRRQIEDAAAILRARWDALDHSYLEKWIGGLGLEREWRTQRVQPKCRTDIEHYRADGVRLRWNASQLRRESKRTNQQKILMIPVNV